MFSILFGMLVFFVSCNKSSAGSFKGKKISVTVEQVAETISTLSQDSMITVKGRFRSGDLDEILAVLKSHSKSEDDIENIKIFLDFSKTEGLKKIKDLAFEDCHALVGIVLPNSVNEIGAYAFYRCKNLSFVSLPDNTISIGIMAFAECESLENIKISKNVKEIGDAAFSDCKALTKIDVNSLNPSYKSVDGIVYSKNGDTLVAFPAGKKINHFKMFESTAKIGTYACFSCRFSTIEFSNKLIEIEDFAFGNCTELTEIIIPDSLKSLGAAFSGCTALKNVTLPKTIDKIYEYSFTGCTALSELIIPTSVIQIGNFAFSDCDSLSSVEIPDSVKKIGFGVFSDCDMLMSATIPTHFNVTSEFLEDVFPNCPLKMIWYGGTFHRLDSVF